MNLLIGLASVMLIVSAFIAHGFRVSRPFMVGKSGQFQRSTARYASATVATKPVVTHPSYDAVEKFEIAEYGLTGALYQHRKSGAQVISIEAPDENKVFGITFRTPPKDSTGVPHVLEHSVLCGSRKFPVKEPFVDLLKGSLQNFLNAFTYPDRTCYPVASTNLKDFYNLVHVYLDAVLHPRAITDPQVLQQEGWHYELEEGVEGPLTVKGVVFNEMKGVYSSPDSLMGRATQQALFPSNQYSVDSGGDPDVLAEGTIQRLSFEQFTDFHASYYHPSNSRIFFYGDDDVSKRLDLLDDYLKDFDAIPVTSQIDVQTKFNEPKSIEVPFPVTPGSEPKHMLTLNWLLNEQRMNAKDMLAWGVLDYLLLGTSSSPLRKALTESSLGESVCGGGLSDELLQATFSIGMKGVVGSDTSKLEKLILETLEKLSVDGFEQDAIGAAMNTFEFRLREFNTGSFPRGLSIMLGMMSQWIYDRPAVDGVRFEAPLAELKAELAAGKPVFQKLLSDYLVKNLHRVRVEMKPDFDMEGRRVAKEQEWLDSVKSSMSAEELKEVMEVSSRLKEAQEAPDSPEARATLPQLGLSDIDPQAKELPIEVLKDLDGVDATVITHDLETSGILYADVLFDYSAIDEEDLELLPLFARMLTETGTKSLDSTALSRRIGANTGGIGVSFHNDLRLAGADGVVADPDDVLLNLLIRGKATTEKIPVLFELFLDILMNAKLDNQKRAVEMLRESKARKESSVLSAGHSYAATRLSGRGSFLGYLNEITGGLTSVRRAGELLDTATNDWAKFSQRLENMRNKIIQAGKDSMVVNLTGNEKVLSASMPVVKQFTASLPTASPEDKEDGGVVARWKTQKKLLPLQNEGFVIPSQVNYVVKGGSILKPGEPVKASYSVASRFLSTGYLWDQIRVMGGAYGGFGRFSEATGRFVFISYRDPNCHGTLEKYDEAAKALSEAEISSEEVLQAVIGSIGDLDAPMTAEQKGFASLSRWLSGESAAARQRVRTEILSTTPADLKEFAQLLAKLREEGTVAVFGSQQAIDQANAVLPASNQLKVEQALPTKSE